ncbi:bifunctional fructose-bisphosphatase/inositol-phosphate phosphatase [Methanogenium sp. S4BF]|uniref:bifunctional fructose-bisphosphatase/inositol-phosphate phosphatase n=1 Tax=Methanogenium sp. S4BF TaxID=1789226 RepID=UPI002415CBCE|nr:bifunctional fructose-bisphosphatase/inositol-phosphate phosphatase [Methanogenium sp. S4BF]WFN35197.1 bifunctional fructose-bisphosphatase/inositol-phosphate phosphatase [Methanogenium sp. S4BF]
MSFFSLFDEITSAVSDAITDIAGTPDAGIIVEMGADGTPTKAIDKIAEDVILSSLRTAEACGEVISEEAGRCRVSDADGIIILDPIDGTYNAIHGIPYYAISAGYMENGEVIAAYISNLGFHEVFTAEKNGGAFLNRKPIRVSAVDTLDTATFSLYGKRHHIDSVMEIAGTVRRWRHLGASALELAYIGCGRIDGFVDMRGTLRYTDAAAGMLICEEAGGRVTSAVGEPVAFSEDVREGRTLVATNGLLQDEIIRCLEHSA